MTDTFDSKFHASRNPGACARDTEAPCAVCGWSERMAIHDEGNRSVLGYGHAYRAKKAAEDPYCILLVSRPALPHHPLNRSMDSKPKCEWCGTAMTRIEGSAETEPGKLQSVGWCPKCEARLWSKPVEKHT